MKATKGQAISNDNIEMDFVKIFLLFLSGFSMCWLSESSKVLNSVNEITDVNEGTIAGSGAQM